MGSQEYYLSNFQGKFTEPVKVNEYTYAVQIEELNYAEEVGKEVLKDNIRYIYSDAYGIANAEEIFIYLPGAPLEELPDGYKNWVNDQISLEGENLIELPFYGLYNKTEECGFSSYDIVENIMSFIEAQSNLAAERERTLIEDAVTQVEMNDLSYQIYEIWDTTLNEEWSVLKQVLDEDTWNALLDEQREWIAYKEQAVQEAAAEVGGGSMASLVANQRAADITKIRVYELSDYFVLGSAATDKTYHSGHYVDTEGTQETYSDLYLSYMGRDEYETRISLYRLTELNGITRVEKDRLFFVDDELNVEGEIVIKGTTAVLKITKSEFKPLVKEDTFQFEKCY